MVYLIQELGGLDELFGAMVCRSFETETDVLPLLSASNVRTLLRAALPLPQLTPEKATTLVLEHLLNRTRSRLSPLRRKDPGPET